MNTYNENLSSSVFTSLQALELEKKNKKSKLEASMLTLYYAEGARITAEEKLDIANYVQSGQQVIKTQAVTNNNISVNLLGCAVQQKKYTLQAVSDAASCAANVQIAANAIVKLASDIGSVYSIVNAADFDSEIYLQSKEAYRLMNETAYDAEKASLVAMDASKLTAEISSNTVADEAKLANTNMGNFLTVANANFDAINALVVSSNSALADASAAEKKAEGELEYVNADYFATNAAYQLNNRELNLNLTVPAKLITADSYTVTFDLLKSPFGSTHKGGEEKAGSLHKLAAGYPVKNYYVLLVKDSKKTTFSISQAESMLLNADQFVKLPPVPAKQHQRDINTQIFISQLLDSDGDRMELGVNYTVFVLAVLQEEYKKRINNFDDYLTAPSPSFCLTNILESPKPSKDNVVVVPPATHHTHQALVFKVTEDKDFNVQYRCMFLPDNTDLITGLLTEKGLRTIEREVERLEKVSDKYEPTIDKLDAEKATLQSLIDGLDAQITDASNHKAAIANDKSVPEKEKQKVNDELEKLKAKLVKAKTDLKEVSVKLSENQKSLKAELSKINPIINVKPGFFFNTVIAAQVSAANYIPVWTPNCGVPEENSGTKVKVHTTLNKEDGSNTYEFQVELPDDVTDNFGNPLVDGAKYIPVVFSVTAAPEENQDQYSNSLSDYGSTHSFSYQSKKVK